MSSTQSAAEFITHFEGFVPHPYQDSAGIWTIGYGSTTEGSGKPVTANTPPITEVEARALLARDLQSCVETIQSACHVQLTDNQLIALDSFIYNVGSGAFRSSTMLRLINAGRFADAADEFVKWDHAGGRVIAGLLYRREAEAQLFRGVVAA